MDYPAALELSAPGYVSPQSQLDPAPTTFAAAALVSPPTKLSFITGTTQIANIGVLDDDSNVVPMQLGYHELVFIFTNGSPGTFLTSGNIATAVVPTQNIPCRMYYDPVSKKYWGDAGNIT